VRLRDTLSSFNVRVEGVTYVGGPTVTRYEVKPAPGVKVASITRLSDDIAMGLEATGAVRIEAPIPGKNAVGIEVPNDKRSTVYLRELIDADSFRTAKSRVTCCLGKGVGGMSVYLDINKMPHLLIAGATGTGKSVCINSLIMSLLYKAKPEEVKLLLIDPKTVEFSVYKDIPHLMAPIICDPKRAAGALNLAVQEMEHRFELLRTVGVRDLSSYNAVTENDRYEHPYIPQMVIIIDELADLMMTAKNEVETSIVRLAQKARAAGIHLVLGTQRPSVDVITGLIKANVPSRISFTVTSRVDSATILDNAGAEKLLGMGDMLYSPIGSSKPQRVQGCFVSDGEVEKIVEFIKRHNDEVRYDKNFLENLDREAELIGNKKESRDDYGDDGDLGDLDPKFYEALGIAVKNRRISTSLLQRAISVGYGRAAKILDQMEEKGFIGPASGNKPREILISEEAYRELMINQD
jgi:S-DNA-T family DNA segregation ATPase FtsK/SpoIIIE